MNTRFLDACWGKPVDRTPVWLCGRQAVIFPNICAFVPSAPFWNSAKHPNLPQRLPSSRLTILGVDAAIMFSDILTPVEPMGMKLDFVPGPVFEHPIRTMADVEALRIPDPEAGCPLCARAIKILRRELAGKVPLIGFGGAPFTLACYMVEGKGSKDWATIKRMMYAAPDVYAALMEKITMMDMEYLNAQIKAGAQAIQIFDTWGGVLSPTDYARYVLPYTTKLINGLNRQNIPVIHFVKGAATMLDIVKKAGGDVMGLDWHVNLGKARDILGPNWRFRGILIRQFSMHQKRLSSGKCRRVLDENAGRPGHIFNLGHGILPTVPPENANFMVECVHRLVAEIA